jgi:two-component system chemotaxis sensor kinase CheA
MATDIDNNEMQVVIQEFLEESRKYADVLNKDLLTIEELLKNNKELPEDLLHEIFRAAHTIKGTSSFLGFNTVFKLMHSMETILDEIRKGKRKFKPRIIDLVFESFDTLESLLDKVESEGNDGEDINKMLTKLGEILHEAPGKEKEVKEEAEKPRKSAKARGLKDKKKPAAKKAKKAEGAEKQIVNETLGDEFLFTNAIMRTFEMLDEMDILKQKNNHNSVFEIYIEKDKVKDAIKKVKKIGSIIKYYKFSKAKNIAAQIKSETELDKNSDGLYLIAAGKKDIIDLEGKEDMSVRAVYTFSESIINGMPPKEKEHFLKEFIDSTETQMEEFSNAMIKLEEDTTNEELINAAFRSMHTIKGSAGFIGLTSFGTTAHKIENIMSKIRDNALGITESVITLLLEGLDTLTKALNDFKNDPNAPSNLLDIQNKLDEYLQEGAVAASAEAEEGALESKEAAAQEGETVVSEFDLETLSATEVSELKEYLKKMENLYEINYTISKDTPIKSMKASLIETKLEKEGVIVKSIPPVDEITDEAKDAKVKVIYISNNDNKFIESQINVDQVFDINIKKIDASSLSVKEKAVEVKKEITEEKKVMTTKKEPKTAANQEQVAKPLAKPIATTTVRVDIEKLDSLMNLAGELVITKARFGQLVSNMKQLLEKNSVYSSYIDNISSTVNELNKSSNVLADSNGDSALSKERGRLEKLFNTLNEHIQKVDIKSSAKEHMTRLLELDENTLKLGKISSDLQNGIMQTRMVPVDNVFSRFRRVVRDLSKSLKKQVNLEIFGEDTELDKKIIDELADPLTHMIRNSLDHGIESSKDRLAKGKDEAGTVTLSAYHKGNHICIQVKDDGKGIDTDKLLRKTIERGLITEKEAEGMSDKDKLDLIFLPGFSMAKEITGVSGRGVGMDVVKNMIESINGSVDIDSKPGEGTTFALNIPLTLAIIQALLIVISDEVYAIPLESVLEIIKVNPKDIYYIDGGETIKLRGHALSIINLQDTIKLKASEKEGKGYHTVVVVTNGEEQLGIILDSLIGEQEIVIKSLSEHFSNVKGIVGASVLGDGTISLILDVQAIIRLAA